MTKDTDNRALRLKTLGNAVCPPQAYPIFRYIAMIENGTCGDFCPYEDLPILPAPFRYVVSEEKADQFHTLRSLMERPDVTELINVCDAGREGELIFRLVYEAAGCSKPFSRL